MQVVWDDSGVAVRFGDVARDSAGRVWTVIGWETPTEERPSGYVVVMRSDSEPVKRAPSSFKMRFTEDNTP